MYKWKPAKEKFWNSFVRGVLISKRIRKIATISFVMSAGGKSLAPTGRIFRKFCIWIILEKSVE
jgi:hypothetical protein